jgi:hypothetical protein
VDEPPAFQARQDSPMSRSYEAEIPVFEFGHSKRAPLPPVHLTVQLWALYSLISYPLNECNEVRVKTSYLDKTYQL